MHKPSLILTIILLAIGGAYFLFQPLQEVTAYQDVTTLPDNTHVKTEGRVLKQTFYQKKSYLMLDTNITIVIENTQAYTTKRIHVQGRLDTYQYPKIQATQVKILTD